MGSVVRPTLALDVLHHEGMVDAANRQVAREIPRQE